MAKLHLSAGISGSGAVRSGSVMFVVCGFVYALLSLSFFLSPQSVKAEALLPESAPSRSFFLLKDFFILTTDAKCLLIGDVLIERFFLYYNFM